MSVESGRWTPGIGDPTHMGWATVAVYFLASLLCFIAAIKTTSNDESISPEQLRGLRIFWISLSLMLIVLGFNKQLDLQSLLTQVGKDLALAQGWYEYRRIIQFLFIFIIGGAGVIALLYLIRKYWQVLDHIKITLAGCFILFIFVLTRAMSFHHMDIFIHKELAGIKMNWLFELGGLVVILLGSIIYSCNITKIKRR